MYWRFIPRTSRIKSRVLQIASIFLIVPLKYRKKISSSLYTFHISPICEQHKQDNLHICIVNNLTSFNNHPLTKIRLLRRTVNMETPSLWTCHVLGVSCVYANVRGYRTDPHYQQLQGFSSKMPNANSNINKSTLNSLASGKMTFMPKFVTVGIFAKPLLPYKSDTHYIVWVCDCRLIYPAYKAHAHYYIVICGCLVLPCISTSSHKRLDFRGLPNIKCVFLISSTDFVWNISHSKQNSASYCHKFTQLFM